MPETLASRNRANSLVVVLARRHRAWAQERLKEDFFLEALLQPVARERRRTRSRTRGCAWADVRDAIACMAAFYGATQAAPQGAASAQR
jgi:hypothetical protein